jgi:large subunit ribosomal protein L19
MNSVITPVKTAERTSLGIRPGDTVRVHQKIVEKGKSRTQVFEGLVIAVKHGTEAGATFTVRATMSGVGVERIFPLFAPFIEKIEITRRSKVRRAKLYFIREKVAREVRRQLRNMRLMKVSTEDFKEEEVVAEEVEETAPETVPMTQEVLETEVAADMAAEEVAPASEEAVAEEIPVEAASEEEKAA